MLQMTTKQEIILRHYRQGHSQRRINRDLGVSRKTIKKYIEEYEKSRSEGGDSGVKSSILTPPKYDTSTRKRRKLTEVMKIEIEKNGEKRKSGQHKQVLRKIDIWEALKAVGYEIGYTTVCNLSLIHI